MTSGILPIVVVIAILLLALYLVANQASIDIAGPLRTWLWERDARRMKARNRYPVTLTRAYWSRRQYDADAARLRELGYEVISENETDGYVKLPEIEWRRGQEPPRRRIPSYFVIYQHGRAGAESPASES